MQLQLNTQTVPVKPGDTRHWGNLPGHARALVISELAQQQERLLFVVTQNQSDAEQLAELLQFFLPKDLSVLRMPDWETLPYDAFSPHQDIISERLKVLYQRP